MYRAPATGYDKLVCIYTNRLGGTVVSVAFCVKTFLTGSRIILLTLELATLYENAFGAIFIHVIDYCSVCVGSLVSWV